MADSKVEKTASKFQMVRWKGQFGWEPIFAVDFFT